MTPPNDTLRRCSLLAASAFLLATAVPSFGEGLLQPAQSIVLKGTHGKFDFLTIDPSKRRLLLAHTGNGSLDVVDLDQVKFIASVAIGAAQAAAIDVDGGRYFVAVSKPPQVVVVDAAKLEVTSKIPLSGPADLIAFHPKSGMAYVDHDDGKDLWVVNPGEGKVAATLDLPGEAPEDLGFDGAHEKLFQSMKIGDVVAVIDLTSNKVVSTWPTAPVQAPHGMAFLPEDHAFLIAGGNGKLVLMSDKDGHVISSTDIPPRVDQIAYDHKTHRVYCASGTGRIGIVALESGKLSALGEVESSQGCHSIAIDPVTHNIWVAYAKGDESMVQTFSPQALAP